MPDGAQTIIGSVEPRPRPARTPLMRQNWRRLLFLHWAVDPEIVQATLPPGLTVETWEGQAWLAIVPFAMKRVRPVGCPPVPGISDFLELNVRTYVRDPKGWTGVWFYSLDCSQPLAVWAARKFFGLPYFRAWMEERVRLAGSDFFCEREGTDRSGSYRYRGIGESAPARARSLEEFLIERYVLFSMKNGALRTAEVWHEPYAIQAAEVAAWSMIPLQLAGFELGHRPPDHAVYSAGVDVEIFGLV